MTDSSERGFQFVMHEPNERLSKENQTKIRRQAMKAVIATRRKAKFTWVASSRDLPLPPHRYPAPPMPLSGLELLVKDRGIDPMDLSALTSIHIGSIASTMLSSEPSQLPAVLLCRQWSYFSYIPTRFGHAAVLDDAFRCLITMAHSILVPNFKPNHKVILSCYGKALNSLQCAVNDPAARYNSEVLCATAMLALFELLYSPNGLPWSHHIAGASRLIQLRGSARFISEFDIALFLALWYPICCETLLNNEACFLDDPSWARVFKSAAAPGETFTNRSEMGIELMILMAKVPGLARRTGHAVVVQDTLQPEDFKAIATDVRAVRSAVITWRRKFNAALINTEERSPSDTADFGKRYELFAISLVINILTSRMLCSIVPEDRALFEEEVQNLAAELKAVQGSVGNNRRAGFYLAQKAKIADAVIASHAYFQEAVGSWRVVEPWRLKKFCESLGRKCCDGVTCCQLDG